MAEIAKKGHGGKRVPRVPASVVERYLEFIEMGCERKDAAEALGTNTATLHRVINEDPVLRDRFQEAWATGAHEVLVPEAHRRGVEGWLEPVIQGGKHVLGHDGKPLYVRKYDSNLLMFTIKARLPEYKDSHRAETQVNVQVNVSDDRSAARDEVWRVLEEVQATRAVNRGGDPQRALPAAEPVLAEP